MDCDWGDRRGGVCGDFVGDAVAMIDQPIRTNPAPYCPECGGRMVLRRPRSGQPWEPFWGCTDYPDCRGTRQILADGRAEEDEPELLDRWL